MPDAATLDVSRETFERLTAYSVMLLKWADRINLIGPRERTTLWTRHVGDSLRMRHLVPGDGVMADLGSGAGFPGLILAIALQREVVLIEADQRKAAFLREAARAAEAAVTVIAQRIEVCGLTDIDIITARALAPLPDLLQLASPLLSQSGVCLFPKGAGVDAELTAALSEWQMSVRRHAGIASDQGCILEVRDLRRVIPEIV